MRYQEELGDYKGWQELEASYRVAGIVRRLVNCDADIPSLQGMYLIRADLEGLSLPGTDFSGANLAKANFEGAQLIGAAFFGTDLTGALLARASLIKANLQNADLSDSFLWRAHFGLAYLGGANFSGAHLLGAEFTGADVEGVDFSGAYAGGVNLDGVKNWRRISSVSGANIFGVRNPPKGFREWALRRGAIEERNDMDGFDEFAKSRFNTAAILRGEGIR